MMSLLRDWRTLTQGLYALDEGQVKALLDAEIEGRARSAFIERLHQRYSVLRTDRERGEYLSKAKK